MQFHRQILTSSRRWQRYRVFRGGCLCLNVKVSYLSFWRFLMFLRFKINLALQCTSYVSEFAEPKPLYHWLICILASLRFSSTTGDPVALLKQKQHYHNFLPQSTLSEVIPARTANGLAAKPWTTNAYDGCFLDSNTWTTMDYNGLPWTTMDYHRLPWTTCIERELAE